MKQTEVIQDSIEIRGLRHEEKIKELNQALALLAEAKDAAEKNQIPKERADDYPDVWERMDSANKNIISAMCDLGSAIGFLVSHDILDKYFSE